MAFRALVLVIIASLAANPALAVFSGDNSPRGRSGDTDYADGIEAFQRQDWQAVIVAMKKVVARRPHHDNAWARLGYAYRKLKQYEQALGAYRISLARNPHNRSALEYLGEAYVELGRMKDARMVLETLAAECRRVTLAFSDGDFSDGCDEWRDLRQSIDEAAGRP
jgi:cytochrome c-type biogenesis protein CcmH/NrfG